MNEAVFVSVMHTAYVPAKLMFRTSSLPKAALVLPPFESRTKAFQPDAFLKYAALLDHDIDPVSTAEAIDSTTGGLVATRTTVHTVVDGWSRIPRLTAKSLLKGHGQLMGNAPGAGQFRREGACDVRCRYTGAVIYTPPPAGKLPPLVDDLMTFAIADDVSPLTKAFVVLLQLLLIHPFADGNGRCARALFAALCMRGGVDHPVALLALARLYGGGATRLHAGSAVLRATGDWQPYLDYARQSVDEAQVLWNEWVATVEVSGDESSDVAFQALWWKAMHG